jgi:shikimate kinase
MRRVLLVGPRGSGKTSVGRALAGQLGWRFVDADEELQRRAGRTIREIIEAEREAGFREREAAVLADLCAQDDAVIATGGGAVLRADNRERLRSAGRVVLLMADVDTLHRRISADPASAATRPNLAGGGRAELEGQLAARLGHYREVAHLTLDTAGRSPEELAGLIVAALRE